MARILAVGAATLDIINEVETYPDEDQEVRALAQSVRRGGNATNTLAVLSQFGHKCEWAGVLVHEPNADPITADLAEYRIGTRFCRLLATGRMPVSYITLSRDTAARTIVHYRNLPEYDFASFRQIPLEEFDWIHFEGRNISETAAMLDYVHNHSADLRISLEVEKPREGIDELYSGADLIVFSAAIAAHYQCDPQKLLRRAATIAPHTKLVCALGAQGAVALDDSGEMFRSAAFVPPVLVDTIGAGDTFNAALIDRFLAGESLPDALGFACRLAGRKCGQSGLGGLLIAEMSRNG